jgi:hypothetical protein
MDAFQCACRCGAGGKVALDLEIKAKVLGGFAFRGSHRARVRPAQAIKRHARPMK